MAKKLKGKATMELKGESKRKREKEYEKAQEFWMKILLIVILIIVAFFAYISYKIVK